MYDYISLRINATPCNEIITDLVADALADIGFESFEPDKDGVTAYIRKDLFNRQLAQKSLENFPLNTKFTYKEITIEGEDWNREWEQNYFQPIDIDGKCVIRSSFHPVSNAPIEILIDPKMAFGTGHHATTAGMVRMLLKSEIKEKDVIDMGTGTGILAILGKKLGARSVTAVEIDPYALQNAEENGLLNKVDINWLNGDVNALEDVECADYFFANINLNVILADLSKYVKKIKSGGKLFLSGFYEKDLPLIFENIKSLSLNIEDISTDNEWAVIGLRKG